MGDCTDTATAVGNAADDVDSDGHVTGLSTGVQYKTRTPAQLRYGATIDMGARDVALPWRARKRKDGGAAMFSGLSRLRLLSVLLPLRSGVRTRCS